MFRKKQPTRASARTRQPTNTVNETFRRNNVVISRRQQELAERQQSVTQRQEQRKKHVSRQRTKAKLIFGAMVLLLCLVAFRMSINQVSAVSNAGTRLTSAQVSQYEAAILKEYRGNTIANQSWLLDSAALEKAVTDQFPEIEHINFTSTAPIGSTLKADIRFRTAVFTWRDASNTDQFVDKNGVLFAKNLDPAVNASKLIKIEDQSGTVLAQGSSVLTANLVQFVGQLHLKVPAVYGPNTTVSRVIIPKSTREVQVQTSAAPYLIKFSSVRSLDEQVGELQSLVGYLNSNKVTPASYIDLRVAHKAFYK